MLCFDAAAVYCANTGPSPIAASSPLRSPDRFLACYSQAPGCSCSAKNCIAGSFVVIVETFAWVFGNNAEDITSLHNIVHSHCLSLYGSHSFSFLVFAFFSWVLLSIYSFSLHPLFSFCPPTALLLLFFPFSSLSLFLFLGLSPSLFYSFFYFRPQPSSPLPHPSLSSSPSHLSIFISMLSSQCFRLQDTSSQGSGPSPLW